MTGADDDAIGQEAADWYLASLRDDMDWDGFARWLEADPRHREAYDQICLADEAAATHAPPSTKPGLPANDDQAPLYGRWPLWLGGAIAASLAVLFVVPELQTPQTQVYETVDSSRTVTLGDGSSIELAPHSRLSVSGDRQETMKLDGGAFFAIRHDPSRPLAIAAGDLTIGDIGTSFDVQATGGAVRVEVSEGEVAVTGPALAAPVKLPAGRRFDYDPVASIARSEPVATQDVGEWREGRLTFENAPLALVAADLARYAGTSLELSPALGQRRFSGTLSIDDGDAAINDLAQLMGLRLAGDPGARRLEPAR